MSSGNDDTKTEDPVLAYALATGALLAAACVMCLILMCCAKCPEWRRRRRQKREKERLLTHCTKVKFSTVNNNKNGTPGDTCAVCLEDFRERETVLVCPCKHGYHKSCITGWMVHSPCCPLCKALISMPSKTNKTAAAASVETTPLLA